MFLLISGVKAQHKKLRLNSMKRLHLFTILILALVAISCDKSELGNKDSLIYISATTEDSFGTKASTKVPYTYAGPSSSNESSH